MSPAAIEALVILAAKYGPDLITGIVALFQKKDVTITDVEATFAPLKPYSAYGIPDVAPKAAALPAVPVTVPPSN